MSRLLGMGFVAFSLLAGSPVMATSHDCTCDEQCASDCSKGKSENCKCKECDCAKGKGCKHGKCNHKKHEEEKQ